ncbi:MAG: MMPL family transporter [Planctomycetota bacterium]|nr:MMPL family transporter [Planctomycetota bacterium]
MPSPQPSRARSALLVLALLVPTFWLAWLQAGATVDVENHALKSVGTREAATEARRVASFGREDVVVVAFQALSIGTGIVTEVEAEALSRLVEKARALPGIGEFREWPEHSAGARVYTVRLDAPEGNYAPMVERLEGLLRRETPPSMRMAISGQPVAEVVIAHEVQRERKRVAPLIALGLTALLFLYYRHAGLVLAILAPAGIAIAWTGGAFVLLGRELDPISVMLQPVLLTVGVASGVHWIEAYLDELSEGRSPGDAARRAVDGLRMPSMLAGLTTVVGFLSLAFNSIPAVVDFGVFAALGVGLSYWIASFLTPALLVLVAARVSPRLLARRGATAGTLGRHMADWIAQRALAVRIAALAVTIGAAVAWTHIEVDNDPQRVLPESHLFRRDTATIASEIGGSDVFDVLVPKESPAANPVQIALLAGAVLELEGVAGPAGPALHAENGDWSVRFLLAPSGSATRERLFDAIESRARALGAGDVLVAGSSVQIARDSGRLVRSSLTGLGASMAVLFVLFWVGFRSLRYAWLAMVPNVMPCVIVYGGLALIGRPLSLATAMISSVMLGLIVDDTIHLLHRYREQRASGSGSLASIEHVFQHSGRAVAITSVALGVGFSLTMFGRLSTTFEFGGLAAVTIAVAALCDLLLLPALLVKPVDAGPIANPASLEATRAG